MGFGPACLAAVMLLGSLLSSGDAGGALYAFFAPIALFVYPSLFALALLLGPMWLLPRILGRMVRPTGQLHLTGDILTADGRRYYLSSASASLSHGPFGAVLDLDGPDGPLRIRGDHATLKWLADHVDARPTAASAPDADSDTDTDRARLQQAVGAAARRGEVS